MYVRIYYTGYNNAIPDPQKRDCVDYDNSYTDADHQSTSMDGQQNEDQIHQHEHRPADNDLRETAGRKNSEMMMMYETVSEEDIDDDDIAHRSVRAEHVCEKFWNICIRFCRFLNAENF